MPIYDTKLKVNVWSPKCDDKHVLIAHLDQKDAEPTKL